MHQILKIGRRISSEDGKNSYKVLQFLGGGGQGEVYRVDLGGNAMALKWYFPVLITAAYRKNLERLIYKGPPNDSFLWPMELVSDPDLDGFGYLMPLRDERFRGIVDLMKRRIEPSFHALAMAGFNLAHSFLQLHSKGMCYSDISFGNVFIHPENGDVLICDNDNCIFDGEIAGIKGTPRFMAPEVVLGSSPNTQTDLYSLAVLLFYMFFLHHPLEGEKEVRIKCFDLPAMKKLYGSEPLFIFDPDDPSNRPVPGFHDNASIFWALYPRFFKDLFTSAFTAGLDDPLNGRVRETQWRSAMLRLRDCIIYCPTCSVENFYDYEKGAESSAYKVYCWSCRGEVTLPPLLKVNQHIVALNYDTRIFAHHVDPSAAFNFRRPVAAVTRHPSKAGIWGLKNISGDKWRFTAANGTAREVYPQKSVTLAVDARINFGKSEGIIKL